MPRLTILSTDEITALYDKPEFNDEERALFFELTEDDELYLETLEDDTAAKINYILQLGYFRSMQFFFQISFPKLKADVDYIATKYFPDKPKPKKNASKWWHYKNQEKIKKLFGMKTASPQFLIKLYRRAKQIAKLDIDAKFIFDQLLEYCQATSIIRPSYSKLQSIVANALQDEGRRLENKLQSLLNKATRHAIDNLFETDEIFYKLTLLKKDPKDFSTKEMRKELEKQLYVAEIFQAAHEIIPKLNISRQNILRYADLVEYYTTSKLKLLGKKHIRLYILCFAWQRFVKINDNLITYFLYKVNRYIGDADDYSIQEIYQAKLADDKNRSAAGKILQLLRNKKVKDKMLRPKAYKMVPENKFDHFTHELLKPNFNPSSYQWQYYSKQARSIKLNLRPAFQALTFNCDKNTKIAAAINFFKDHLENQCHFDDYDRKEVPTDFIPNKLLRYVFKRELGKKKRIDADRYEFMLYLRLKKAIESGSAFIKDSINYRHLEDELIPLAVWLKDKDKILRKIGNPMLMKPIEELLLELEQQLHKQYIIINRRIKSGHNQHIKLDSSKSNKVTWRLPYKRREDSINNPFYEQLPTSNINDVMRFVAERTGFLQYYTHVKPKYAKSRIKLENLIGYTVGSGTGIGKNRISDISDLKRAELQSTERNFIRLETMRKSNDGIINYTAKLPIFQHYNLSEYGVHVSLDGQNLETKYMTIKARYSTKDFGKHQGVVSYTLVANHLPINTKIIGANEHESHYVLDIVRNNTSDIDIYAVSGDMHSINRVNFALLHLFGYRFMPRLTSITKKAEQNLVCFRDPEVYSKYLIKPSSQINKQQIIKEWDNILRILASLALKETTQSTIVRKLSSYSKTNPTLKALIEFDKIIFSSYVLDYINDGDLRSTVHRALNRGEAFHQLRSSILKVSGRKLDGRTELELNISNECNRLLANCIICYNALLLSELLEGYQRQGKLDMVEKIKRLSPVAWQHINLVGKFEFCSGENIINLQKLTRLLLSNPKIGFSATGQ